MAWNWGDALRGGAQAALLTSKSGNPYVIGGSALVGAIAQGSSAPEKIDRAPYDRAMRRLRKSLRGRANRAKSESSAQLATNLRSRGLDGGLAQGIAEGNRRMIQQRADDFIGEQEANLEMSLADAEVGLERSTEARRRQDTANLGIAALGTIDDIADPDEFDTPFIQSIQQKLGIEPFTGEGTQATTGARPVTALDYKNIQPVPEIAGPTSPMREPVLLERDNTGNFTSSIDDDMQSLQLPSSRELLNEIQNRVPRSAKVSVKDDAAYIMPTGSNKSFPADSLLGEVYIVNAPGVDYMARNIPGGWDELIEYLA